MAKRMAPNSKGYKEKRKLAGQLYSEGYNEDDIQKLVNVSMGTIQRWKKQDKWERAELTRRKLEEEIIREADKALLIALKAFKANPNKDLQSINSMLKRFLERKRPDKKINEYIIIFCEDLVDFCIDTGNNELRKQFQEVLTDFAEYARRKHA